MEMDYRIYRNGDYVLINMWADGKVLALTMDKEHTTKFINSLMSCLEEIITFPMGEKDYTPPKSVKTDTSSIVD